MSVRDVSPISLTSKLQGRDCQNSVSFVFDVRDTCRVGSTCTQNLPSYLRETYKVVSLRIAYAPTTLSRKYKVVSVRILYLTCIYVKDDKVVCLNSILSAFFTSKIQGCICLNSISLALFMPKIQSCLPVSRKPLAFRSKVQGRVCAYPVCPLYLGLRYKVVSARIPYVLPCICKRDRFLVKQPSKGWEGFFFLRFAFF